MKKIYKDNYLEELKLTNGKQKDRPDFRVLQLDDCEGMCGL